MRIIIALLAINLIFSENRKLEIEIKEVENDFGVSESYLKDFRKSIVYETINGVSLCIYYDDKSDVIRVVGQYHESTLRDGQWITYYPNGSVEKIVHYQKGTLDGSVVLFRDSGYPSFRCFIKNGVRQGISMSYYEDGKILSVITGYNSFGEEDGFGINFDKFGNITDKITLVDGQSVKP